MSNVEIAENMDMSPVGVGLIINSPMFQDEITRRREKLNKQTDEIAAHGAADAKNHLDENALEAARTLTTLNTEGSDDRVRLQSATAILDRVLDKGSTKGVTLVINAEQIENLQLALIESGQGKGV